MRESTKLAIAIYVVSLAIRSVMGLWSVAFAQDQARDTLFMEQYARNGQVFVGYGPKASVGDFYSPPFYYQLSYWVARLTNFHPLAIQWVIIVVEAATPVLLFLILTRFVSPLPALLASLLYSFSPLALDFSTPMWNPSMIPFFTTLSWLCFLLYVETAAPLLIIGGVLGLVVAFHLHYQTAVLGLFLLVMLFYSLTRHRQHVMYWVAAAALGGLLFVPYVMAEVENGWKNTLAIVNYFLHDHSRIYERVSKPAYVLTFLPSFFERMFFRTNLPFVWFGRGLFFGGLGLMAYFAVVRRTLYRWLLLYIGLLFFMLRIYKGDKIDYYLSTLFILPFVFVAFFLQKLPRRMAVLGACVLMFFAGADFSARNFRNGYADILSAATFVAEQVTNQPVRVLLHHKDMRNTFVYGFHRTRVNTRSDARIVVDVCQEKQQCSWDGTLASKYDAGYEQAALLKMHGYTPEAFFANDSYQIVIGRLP